MSGLDPGEVVMVLLLVCERVCERVCISVQALFASESITLLGNKASQPMSIKMDKTSKAL